MPGNATNQDIVNPWAGSLPQGKEYCRAQHRGQMIEVPRDIFNNLVAYLNGVPQDVTRLRARVSDIQRRPVVQAPTSFPKFADLPTELRVSYCPQDRTICLLTPIFSSRYGSLHAAIRESLESISSEKRKMIRYLRGMVPFQRAKLALVLC